MNNYRVDVFYRGIAHYKTEFAEYWLAKTFAEAIKDADGVARVFMLQRMSNDKFDITAVVKQKGGEKMTKYGWWQVTFDLTLEGETVRFADLSECTQEHIAELIKQGYWGGEIVEETDEEE